MKKLASLQIYALLASVLFFVCSCKKDHQPVYSVPNDVQNFIDIFKEEAEKRNYPLDIEDLIVEFNTNLILDNDEKAGICTYGSSSQSPLIELDTSSLNWQLNEFTREMLVMHELGHCILERREHDNSLLSNKLFSSFMRADGNPLYGRLSQFKRSYYFDELFDQGTETPDWGNLSLPYEAISSAQKAILFSNLYDGNIPQQNSNGILQSIQNGFYSIENTTDSPQIINFSELLDVEENADFELEINVKMPENSSEYFLLNWGMNLDNQENVEDSYYFGFSNDGFVDLGEFSTQTFFNAPRNEITAFANNKLTVRKVGDFYYFYVNESFFDVISYESLPGERLGVYINPQTIVQIDDFTVFLLN